MNSGQLGLYAFSPEALSLIGKILINSVKVKLFGIPKIVSDDLQAMATTALHRNMNGPLLTAGSGHFHFMWVSDLGVAFRGLSKVAPADALQVMLEHMLTLADAEGVVHSCYSQTKGFDAPYFRADSFPWLMYCVGEFVKVVNSDQLVEKYYPLLQKLLTDFETAYVDSDGMLLPSVMGDWVDTIRRPSSTWNNLCWLNTVRLAEKFGLVSKVKYSQLQKKMLAERFSDSYFFDYHHTTQESVDAGVLALYLGIFDKKTRLCLADRIGSLPIHLPCSMQPSLSEYPQSLRPLLTRVTAGSYHQTACWPHLGLMYLNGLKKIDISNPSLLESVEAVITQHQNFLETVGPDGQPLTTILAREYGFSMFAGQYLELRQD